jgi:hypothetical protein
MTTDSYGGTKIKRPRWAIKELWPWDGPDRLSLWERWHADPKRLGLEPEPLLWWETDVVRKEEEWPLAA